MNIMMKKNMLLHISISMLIGLTCHSPAIAQTLDTPLATSNLILKNHQSVLDLERSLGLHQPTSNYADLKKTDQFEERLKVIQQTIRKNIQLNSLHNKSLQGGVDSGGGNLVLLKSGKLRLLDFYIHSENSSQSNLNSLPAIPIKETKALRSWGIDALHARSTIYTETIHELLRQLETTSPFAASLISSAIFHMPIYVVNYELALQDNHFYLPNGKLNKDAEKIVTGAIYFKNFGVFVSKKHFDLLSFEDQVGLLIHESLRHLQITHDFHFSDQDLQELTRAIVQSGDTPPTLDSAQFLNGKIRNAYYLALDQELNKLLLQLKSSQPQSINSDDPFAVISNRERELSISRQTNFHFLDRIIMDYETKGWTQFKEEAHLILQLLQEQKIIRLVAPVH